MAYVKLEADNPHLLQKLPDRMENRPKMIK